MLCENLERLGREGGREGDTRGKRYGDICICIADSLCYKAETNTPLQSNYTPIKMLKKIKKHLSCFFLFFQPDLMNKLIILYGLLIPTCKSSMRTFSARF